MNVRNMRECEEVVGSYREHQEISTEVQRQCPQPRRGGISGDDECDEEEGDEEVVGSYRKTQEIATEAQR